MTEIAVVRCVDLQYIPSRDSECSSVYTYSTYMAEVAVVECLDIQNKYIYDRDSECSSVYTHWVQSKRHECGSQRKHVVVTKRKLI